MCDEIENYEELLEEAQGMSVKDVVRMMDHFRSQLKDMEEKCEFWCREARKLGYKE